MKAVLSAVNCSTVSKPRLLAGRLTSVLVKPVADAPPLELPALASALPPVAVPAAELPPVTPALPPVAAPPLAFDVPAEPPPLAPLAPPEPFPVELEQPTSASAQHRTHFPNPGRPFVWKEVYGTGAGLSALWPNSLVFLRNQRVAAQYSILLR